MLKTTGGWRMASDESLIAWYGWRNSETRISCFDRDGEILMAVEGKTFRPANVSWGSFPFCFCCLLMKLTLFWHSIFCRMWVSTGFGSGRAYIKTPTHAFAVYWWSWVLPCHRPSLRLCHSNRSCQISNWCRNWWRYKGKCIRCIL